MKRETLSLWLPTIILFQSRIPANVADFSGTVIVDDVKFQIATGFEERRLRKIPIAKQPVRAVSTFLTVGCAKDDHSESRVV